MPLPSASKKTVPWLETVCRAVPALMVAWMVMVTEAPAAMLPFQCTVLPPVVAVPLVAEAPVRVSDAGSTSVNSSPGLSCCAEVPEFWTITV